MITEEAFNKQYPPDNLLSSKLRILQITNCSDLNDNKKEKKKKKKKTIKSPEHNIFESDHSGNSCTQVFSSQTNYHLSLPEPKFSNVSLKDRKWYRWYTDQLVQGHNEKLMVFESKFKVCQYSFFLLIFLFR